MVINISQRWTNYWSAWQRNDRTAIFPDPYHKQFDENCFQDIAYRRLSGKCPCDSDSWNANQPRWNRIPLETLRIWAFNATISSSRWTWGWEQMFIKEECTAVEQRFARKHAWSPGAEKNAARGSGLTCTDWKKCRYEAVSHPPSETEMWKTCFQIKTLKWFWIMSFILILFAPGYFVVLDYLEAVLPNVHCILRSQKKMKWT